MEDAVRAGILAPVSDAAAEEVTLTEAELETELDRFVRWANANMTKVLSWTHYHLHTPRIQVVRRHVGPWKSEGRESEVSRLVAALPMLPVENLWFAYQTYVRTVQYYQIAGKATAYFPHPIRETALGEPPSHKQSFNSWSWGIFLYELMKGGVIKRDRRLIVHKVAQIKEITEECEASIYNLDGLSLREQSDRLVEVAVRVKMPMSVEARSRKLITALAHDDVDFADPIKPKLTYVLGQDTVLAKRRNGRTIRIPYFKARVGADRRKTSAKRPR